MKLLLFIAIDVIDRYDKKIVKKNYNLLTFCVKIGFHFSTVPANGHGEEVRPGTQPPQFTCN